MSSLSNIMLNASFYSHNITISNIKLVNPNILLNNSKLKCNKRNLCTLTSFKNDLSINRSINNKNNILYTGINTNIQLRNLNQAFSSSCNNLFLNNFNRKDNHGNVNNGFILLDEDEINIQQLGNLFRGFFIYNKNNSHNKRQANYYYNNNPYHSKKHNNRNKKKRKRLIFKNFHLNNRNVFYFLLGLNVVVFAAWQYAIEQAQSYNNYKYYRFMEDNFCVSWDRVVKKKHWWTLLTSAFSHQEKMHFIMNMLVFNSFASPVIRALGPENFLALYLFTGVCSSLSHITFNHFLLPKMNKETMEESFFDFFFPQQNKAIYDSISSLGASGAIMGINTLFACLYPHSIIQYGMFLPLPAWLGMSLYTIMDIYRTATMTNGRIDTAGHVGGALSGLLFYIIKIRPYIQKW
ncbi:rhomboid-domain-containing protein [Neocallimastix lanati (nom. inval.)]|uniref:Rhomboid-domain-containing protein n=1 Tax=Neocallimastix californiae TaxID=1754190 RepID=A0A1Y2AJC2_9FUNG|nr:rhomboid-domain-containing protein [Neocallimastix sp. JGI-2020a]ORY22673.1 rhomboid-domain-containing protein [Neocallimastix californiae]|eukprot:ORY22673.1 rhomboid-domain-containing protein [Neocallimastix californiae]